MAKIMYKVSVYGSKPITTVEIEHETEKFVLISGHVSKDAKRGDGRGFFDTYEEAKDFLVQHYQKLVRIRQDQLDAALSCLQQAMSLEE